MVTKRMKSGIIILVISSVLFSCGTQENEFVPRRDKIVKTVFASGQIDALEHYVLTAQVDGYLGEILFDEGDSLVAGSSFAEIRNLSNDFNSLASQEQLFIAEKNVLNTSPALVEIKANLDIATAKFKQEDINVQRYRSLFANSSVSKSELENAELSFLSAQKSKEALEQRFYSTKSQAEQYLIQQKANSQVSKLLQSYNKVEIPFSGTVLNVIRKKGDFVKKGDPIAEIANLKTMIAKLNVDESSISYLRKGMEAIVVLNTSKQTKYKCIVDNVYPIFDEASQSYLCDLRFIDVPESSFIGTRLEANVIVEEKDSVLIIDRKYLDYSNSVQVKGEKDVRKVEVGIKSNEWVEIISGISEADVLIPHKK